MGIEGLKKYAAAELDTDWIHPRIGLDSVGLDWVILCNTFCGLDWIGSDREK